MKKLGLYNSSFEHDACGIGAVVNIKGKKSHDVIDNCLEILENLKHRGWIGGLTWDKVALYKMKEGKKHGKFDKRKRLIPWERKVYR